MARATRTVRRSTRNTAASKPPKWIDRAKKVPYPQQLWGDPLYDRAIAHARATPYIKWDRFIEFLLTDPRADVEKWIEEKDEEALRRAQAHRDEAESERWESQAFEVPPKPKSGHRGKFVGALVWMYHGTSTALLGDIKRNGLQPDAPKRTWSSTTRGWVYLTRASGDGPGGAWGYALKAAREHGGDPVVLRVIVPWNDLSPDLDDRDISAGAHQYRMKYGVPPSAIFEVDDERVRGTIGPEYIDEFKLWSSSRPRTPGKWFER